MPLPVSGTMSLSQARVEFSKALPMAFSALYSAASGIPTSGTMSLSQFYGKGAGASAPTTPRWGVGSISTYTESSILAVCTNAHTYTTDQTFSTTMSDNYGYFIIPVAYNPTFINVADGYSGGWDGASWLPPGEFGSEYIPVPITIGGQAWKIYRTDWAASGVINWRVVY